MTRPDHFISHSSTARAFSLNSSLRLLHSSDIDYYGVTFDHLVSSEDDENPEVLQINMLEMEDDEGAFARAVLPFEFDYSEYAGRSILALPRCCQKREGTQDRSRVNFEVADRDMRSKTGKSLDEREWTARVFPKKNRTATADKLHQVSLQDLIEVAGRSVNGERDR